MRLDLKNMEYKAVDDTAVSGEGEKEGEEEERKEEEGEEKDVHGFLFRTLLARKGELEESLRMFRESLQQLDISPGDTHTHIHTHFF